MYWYIAYVNMQVRSRTFYSQFSELSGRKFNSDQLLLFFIILYLSRNQGDLTSLSAVLSLKAHFHPCCNARRDLFPVTLNSQITENVLKSSFSQYGATRRHLVGRPKLPGSLKTVRLREFALSRYVRNLFLQRFD